MPDSTACWHLAVSMAGTGAEPSCHMAGPALQALLLNFFGPDTDRLLAGMWPLAGCCCTLAGMP